MKYKQLTVPRPQHPDMDQLGEIVRDMDHLAETTDDGFVAVLNALDVNVKSVAWMVQQRALRALELLVKTHDGIEIEERERLIIIWLDAFTAGYRMAEERQALAPPAVVDAH